MQSLKASEIIFLQIPGNILYYIYFLFFHISQKIFSYVNLDFQGKGA